MIKHLHALTLAAALGAAHSSAATLITNPVADTTLNENAPNNNMGGHLTIHAGSSNGGTDRRALVAFDLSSIPSGATITSASLQLTIFNGSVDVGSTYGLHPMLTSWVEGNKAGNNGAAASAGEATWNTSGTSAWGAPGGSAGADYIASSSASTAVTGLGDYTFTSAGLASDVQGWIDGGPNNGWILISESEGTGGTARRFGSRDSNSPPILTIEYIPEPSATLLVAFGSMGLLLRRRTR